MASNLLTDMREIMQTNAIEPNVAEQVISELSALWAGINVYFPKRHAENSDKFKSDICRDYQNGVPVNQIVKKYKITQAWVYKIIKDSKTTNSQPQKAWVARVVVEIQRFLQLQITAKFYRSVLQQNFKYSYRVDFLGGNV